MSTAADHDPGEAEGCIVQRLSYGSHARQVIDLYSPSAKSAAAASHLPLLVFLHG